MEKDDTKKPRERSREYPLYDIPFCVELTESINSKLGNRFSSLAQLSKTFDKSVTYIASQLSSCKQYNLLELKKGDGYKPTDIFFKVTRGRTDSDKREALLACIKSPAIYGDFIQKYDGQELPSDLPSIFYWDYKITEAAKDGAAKTFIDNLNFLGLITEDGKLIVDGKIENLIGIPVNQNPPIATTQSQVHQPVVSPPAILTPLASGHKKADIKISNGRFVTLEFPADISSEEIDRLVKNLHLWKD